MFENFKCQNYVFVKRKCLKTSNAKIMCLLKENV